MKKFFISIFIFLIINTPIKADDLSIIGLGVFDFNKQKDEAIDFRYERRLDKKVYDIGPSVEPAYTVKPFYGIEVTSDNAGYVLGGIYIEERVNSNIFFTPNIGVGLYDEGDGKKLGSSIEFRSGLELSYELENERRIGISISHISNASIGDKNPGTEIISISYQIPY